MTTCVAAESVDNASPRWSLVVNREDGYAHVTIPAQGLTPRGGEELAAGLEANGLVIDPLDEETVERNADGTVKIWCMFIEEVIPDWDPE